MMKPMGEAEVTREDFLRYFPHAPTALCIKECARLSALRPCKLEGPVLDVGCGDGVFAGLAFSGLDVWGIDINPDEVRLATRSRAYSRVLLGDITSAPLPSQFFGSCVANCSLEHVPRLDLALRGIFDALQPGGRFFSFLPNADWARFLLSYRALVGVGFPSAAQRLQESVDRFFQHHHLHDAEGWRVECEAAGFVVHEVQPVLSSATTTAFEAFLLPSLAGWANRRLLKRWTNWPELRKSLSKPVYRLVDSVLSVGDSNPTAEFLVVASRPLESSPVGEPSEQPK